MPQKTDPGPVVFDVTGASLGKRMVQAARQIPQPRRAAHVREVCQGCADVIALTPPTTWMAHVATLLERLDTSGGEENSFARELQRLIPVLQVRAGGGAWRALK